MVYAGDAYGAAPYGGSAPASATPPTSISYADLVLSHNPLAYYRLGESSGSLADSSGNGKTLTGGVVSYSQGGAINNDTTTAITFIGNEYNNATGGFGDTQTLIGWVKTTDAGNAYVFGTYFYGNGVSYFSLGVSGGKLYARINGNATVLSGVGPTVSDGAYHMWALTYNSGTMTTYVDGVQIATTTGAALQSLSDRPFLGGRFGGWLGTLDEVAFLPGSLTSDQISNLYNVATQTPTYLGFLPWVPAAINTAASVITDDKVNFPAIPNQMADKWLPKANEVEFTVFVDGASTVTTGGRTVELDPLALEADVLAKATLTADLQVSAIQTVSAEQIKTAIRLQATDQSVANEHLKIAGEQDRERWESQAHAKSAVILTPDQVRDAQEHAKVAGSGSYPTKDVQQHAKVAVVGGEVGKGSNSQTHMKVASISDFTEPEVGSAHIKIAAPTLAAEIQDSANHLKIAELNAVAEIQNTQDHLKIAEATKADAQNLHEHLKAVIKIDGFPVSTSAASLIVATSGVDKRQNSSEHIKALIEQESVDIVGQGHAKAAVTTTTLNEVTQAHTKVLARIPSSENVTAAHVKVAQPYVANKRVGWGILI